MKRNPLRFIPVLTLFLVSPATAGIVNGSFETGDLTGWRSAGGAGRLAHPSNHRPEDAGSTQPVVSDAVGSRWATCFRAFINT